MATATIKIKAEMDIVASDPPLQLSKEQIQLVTLIPLTSWNYKDIKIKNKVNFFFGISIKKLTMFGTQRSAFAKISF